MISINQNIPDVSFEIFQNEEVQKKSFADYKGKWLILLFYPADFSFICPTELEQTAILYSKFQEEGAEVLSISTDTVYVHKAWHDNSPQIKKITFPMVADPSGQISREFGCYIENEGLARRGSFVIDPDGVLKAFEIHDNDIGRSIEELLRKLQAAKFVREHDAEVCPVNWKPGGKTLSTDIALVGQKQ